MNRQTVLQKIRAWRRKAPPSAYFFGWLLRRKFTHGGLIIAMPGWPKPRVRNHGGQIFVENCAFFPGVRLEVWQGGKIFIGGGTYLNRHTEVIAQQEVHIGRHCMIAWDVVIMDTDEHGFDGALPVAQPVIIGNHVWIGCRALILKGVHIGDRAIIGAGAIVTRDVPPGGVVTGPAATLRRVRPLPGGASPPPGE